MKNIDSVHPETLPKLKLWIPRYPLFGVQSFSFGNIFGVSGWTLDKGKGDSTLKRKVVRLELNLASNNWNQSKIDSN